MTWRLRGDVSGGRVVVEKRSGARVGRCVWKGNGKQRGKDVKYDRSVDDDRNGTIHSIPTITFAYPASHPQRRPRRDDGLLR